MLRSLSGRFLILTVVTVMLAEVLIFLPSIARFREGFLTDRLERAQIASLARLADDALDPDIEEELLLNAGVFNVVLRRDEARQLVLAVPMPGTVSQTYDMRDPGALVLLRDAVRQLVDPEPRLIRVIGAPSQEAGKLIEVTMSTRDLRAAMVEYGVRILILSLVISLITAVLLFLAVRRLLVKPIRSVVTAMQSYAAAPDDARRIIEPAATVRELREAEDTLQTMQTQLTQALKQRQRLAQVGGAVARISHDLRNILTTAQLFTDRIERSDDPVVNRMAPKIVASISRAVSLCESTLAFGRAEEPAPQLTVFTLADMVEEVIESERLAVGEAPLRFVSQIPPGLQVRGDPEQVHRMLSNLVRNARQALLGASGSGEIRVSAEARETDWRIEVADDGPGLPPKAREHLFKPFEGGARKGGAGLGLAIVAELAAGHGGQLDLVKSDENGTVFAIHLPMGGLD